MKKISKISLPLLCIAAAISLFSSCQKAGQSPTKSTSTSVNTPAFTTSQAVVLSATASDTVYAVNICHPGDLADSVAFNSLPDAIGKYLTANYSGYTFTKAYEILSSTKVIEGYVVTIVFNGNRLV